MDLELFSAGATAALLLARDTAPTLVMRKYLVIAIVLSTRGTGGRGYHRNILFFDNQWCYSLAAGSGSSVEDPDAAEVGALEAATLVIVLIVVRTATVVAIAVAVTVIVLVVCVRISVPVRVDGMVGIVGILGMVGIVVRVVVGVLIHKNVGVIVGFLLLVVIVIVYGARMSQSRGFLLSDCVSRSFSVHECFDFLWAHGEGIGGGLPYSDFAFALDFWDNNVGLVGIMCQVLEIKCQGFGINLGGLGTTWDFIRCSCWEVKEWAS